MKLRKDKWEKVRIGDIALIQYGSSKKMQTGEEGFKTFRMNEIANGLAFDNGEMKKTLLSEDEFQNYRLEKGDILFNRTNSYELVGRTGIFNLDGDYMFASYLLRLKINPQKADSFFITHLMTSHVFQKQLKTVATKAVGQANINPTNLKKQILPLPPLAEQKQIAALFQSLETAMEKVDGQEQHLKSLQKTLVNGLVSTHPVFGNLLNSNNCKPTTIGTVAECDKKYPEHEKEVERFVGLEWIEAENFQLQGFGLVANGTTFTKRFANGDVLFGKRRAYLKKVAVADFDGICSGDILVIRAKAKKMLQGLLPYYISSDAFIQHAVGTSAGSLSPRTKWKDLSELEVSIPDIKTQSTILEVLQQLNTTINQLKQQKMTLNHLKQKLLNEILG